MRLTMMAAVMLLVGCAPAFDVAGRTWTKPNTSIQQVTLDETECARAAYDAGWTPDLILGGLLDVGRVVVQNGAQIHTYTRCMTKQGYRHKAG